MLYVGAKNSRASLLARCLELVTVLLDCATQTDAAGLAGVAKVGDVPELRLAVGADGLHVARAPATVPAGTVSVDPSVRTMVMTR